MFNPGRLTLARRRRGLTKVRLAELTSLSVKSVVGFESGKMNPLPETVEALGRALRFPPEFFYRPDTDEPLARSASFRAMTSMTAGQRDAALASGALAFELSAWIEKRFTLPDPALPDLRGSPPEAAAADLRAQWGMGELPVTSMVHLLEAKGVRVFSLTQDCREVDAFSLWRGTVPFVFLNTMKSGERGRFDAAHELGHLVLHRHGGPGGRDAEQEADRFASAFLMPEGSVLATVPRYATLPHLVKLKKRWKVALIALTHRLRGIGLVSEWEYRHLCIDIARRGYRKSEPEGIPRETSQVLEKVFAALRAEGLSKADVARELRIHTSDIDALVFGLVLGAVPGSGGGGASTPRRPPSLRIV